MQLVSDEHTSGVAQVASDALVKQLTTHMSVYS